VPDPATFNRQNLVAIRAAVLVCNKDGADLLKCTKGLAAEAEAFHEMRTNWQAVLEYFDLLMGIVEDARKRIEVCAEVCGIMLREVA
jgi:hypothetical protein